MDIVDSGNSKRRVSRFDNDSRGDYKRRTKQKRSFESPTSMAIAYGLHADMTEQDVAKSIQLVKIHFVLCCLVLFCLASLACVLMWCVCDFFDLFGDDRSYSPVGIAIVRNSVNVPMYGLVQFDSISRCITFVEENEYASGSYRMSNDCILELNYIRKDDPTVLNAQFVPAMSSDWLCHQCFYYNLSKNETCQNCRERRRLDCTRVSSEGHPYIPGEVICNLATLSI